MSDAIYPTLPGISWSFIRTPIWKTTIQPTQSGRELRSANMSYPIYKYTLTYDVLRSDPTFAELQTLIAFFNARSGSFDSFLFADPDDGVVTSGGFGTGDGVTKSFQLIKSYGGYAEPVIAVHAVTQVAVGGVATAAYTVANDTGILTFTSAPALGALLTWSGSFYYRCRFVADTYDFEKFMQNLWLMQKIDFQTTKL
jgi:uncharacterized protein (TIGR02217 family)